MTTTKLNKRNWNTYLTTCYTYDVANDQRSAGGVHHHQVRRTASGWQKRICQTNWLHRSFGAVEVVDDATGAALFARAEHYA